LHPRVIRCHSDGILPAVGDRGRRRHLVEQSEHVKSDQNNHGEHDRHHNGAETAQAVGEEDHGQGPFNGATVRDGVTVRKVFDCPATPKQAPGVHTTSAPQAAAHEPATASAPAPITHPPPETTLTVVLADACPVRDSTTRVRVSLSAQKHFPRGSRRHHARGSGTTRHRRLLYLTPRLAPTAPPRYRRLPALRAVDIPGGTILPRRRGRVTYSAASPPQLPISLGELGRTVVCQLGSVNV